jgi:TctA family transporter
MFFMRPISLGISVLILIGILMPVVRFFKNRNKTADNDQAEKG